MKPIEAAQNIITSQFPNCDVALLGGSVARGEATKTSDLDIVIVDQSLTLVIENLSIVMDGLLRCLFIILKHIKPFSKWIVIEGDLRYHN